MKVKAFARSVNRDDSVNGAAGQRYLQCEVSLIARFFENDPVAGAHS